MGSADEKGYNGWTNYETWCVNLWLDNDEGTQNMVREWARECYEDAVTAGPTYEWDTPASMSRAEPD